MQTHVENDHIVVEFDCCTVPADFLVAADGADFYGHNPIIIKGFKNAFAKINNMTSNPKTFKPAQRPMMRGCYGYC